MSDEPRDAAPKQPEDVSASAIFAAMLREAAAKSRGISDSSQPTEAIEGEADGVAEKADTEDQPSPPQAKRPPVQRITRGRLHRQPHGPGVISGFFRTSFIVILSAGLVATLLTWFTNPQFINPAVVRGLQANALLAAANAPLQTPTPIATPKWHYRIGIISGHRGRDSGAVCEDGWGIAELIERDINFAVAEAVVANLKADNYTVDLLDENDPRLDNYQATALVSIHANTCQDFGEVVSGFIVSKADSRPDYGDDTLLRECIALNYDAWVPLQRSFVETADMTDYHNFRIIHPLTPAIILEMGYMLADRDILVNEPDLLAHAITQGIHCFLGASGAVPELAQGDPPYRVPVIATPTPPARR